jgi:hypothetical protein
MQAISLVSREGDMNVSTSFESFVSSVRAVTGFSQQDVINHVKTLSHNHRINNDVVIFFDQSNTNDIASAFQIKGGIIEGVLVGKNVFIVASIREGDLEMWFGGYRYEIQ